MTKETMCCPVCNAKLRPIGGFWDCPNDHRTWAGTEGLWQALIQANQDLEKAKADIEDYKKYKVLWEQIRNNTILELERKLEMATKALKEYANEEKWGCIEDDRDRVWHKYWYFDGCDDGGWVNAQKALEQIEHKG